jgi:hypothetical protein
MELFQVKNGRTKKQMEHGKRKYNPEESEVVVNFVRNGEGREWLTYNSQNETESNKQLRQERMRRPSSTFIQYL